MIRAHIKKIILSFIFSYLSLFIVVGACANGSDIEKNVPPNSYCSSSWQVTMNAPDKKNNKYPDKRKITPETLRVALDEYYVPQISELLGKGIDCFEWVNHLDDPYLSKYKLDLRVDPDDDRVNLFWKRKF
jgi:hypothetical protein